MSWFVIDNVDTLDSPALVIYKERVAENIRLLISMVKSVDQLRPHVKTNKIAEVCKMMMDQGIYKFKCATIAEAEMLAMLHAPDVLLAYQPIGPKAKRLLRLVETYPDTHFSCITDDITSANNLSELFANNNRVIDVYIDLNTGMNRTGIRPLHALQLIEIFQSFSGIKVVGLHAYDGHIRDADYAIRKEHCDEAFQLVSTLADAIKRLIKQQPKIVIGGTPTFPIHAHREGVECSPGTFIFWDWGYQNIMPDEPFIFAALVVTRIISIPDADTVCTDLGHKSVAAENPFPRVHFLNLPGAEPIGQSEEHLMLRVPDTSLFAVGDVLYGVPFHICPTVALYDTAKIVEDKNIVDSWRVIARDRAITI
ncbi:D-TA family PLP-dependent enzyme [Panacibacter ginsenosidivorans]|uniref:D-TA family PLP-dependent enzyme n=1 Tax=Panacibacter ginsenosidivorans TaxID=1813871 RepID=A0A5B8VDV4_9BACT|nr:D-TA family PLP-dependent enzyme [Panacibacter ginsenosidivorans]QEC69654.1 D-TA family PLP-dependent enzyme [Panacibacter ginsenosidivorans]